MTAQTGSVTTVYQVTGMSCGHCEGSVSGEISQLPGVSSVKAVASTGEVTVARSPTALRAWEVPPLAAPGPDPSTSSTRDGARHAESTHLTPRGPPSGRTAGA